MFSSKWRQEERLSGVTPLQKTTKVLEDIMNGICGWLVLTMETEGMFNGLLPKLDMEIWFRDDNKILYQYFEKAMVPTMVLHRRFAMPAAGDPESYPQPGDDPEDVKHLREGGHGEED
jgi:hypothetical protein